jgi:hypothetical protein
MHGVGGGERAQASCIDSSKVPEAVVVAGLLIEFELSLVKVKEDCGDSCLPLEQEVEEVEEVIVAVVKISAEVLLVREGEGVLVRGNCVSSKTT